MSKPDNCVRTVATATTPRGVWTLRSDTGLILVTPTGEQAEWSVQWGEDGCLDPIDPLALQIDREMLEAGEEYPGEILRGAENQ